MSNKKINTTELDFDAIKSNLKEYLRGQDQFRDFDFEGSSMSILLDVLAYNTHYNALYTNLAVNEAFIDSASKRTSVVSKAKELGYTPQSTLGATARINVVITTNSPNAPEILELPRLTRFSSMVDGFELGFHTVETLLAPRVDGRYTFNNVRLKEGNLYNYSFVYSDDGRYIIPNKNIDLTTLRVTVQENAQSLTFKTLTRSESIVDLTRDSQVYFIKEIEGELFELEFGDGIIGAKLDNGNVISVEYLISKGEQGNNAKVFTYSDGNIVTGQNTIVSTLAISSGGSAIEDIESIRWNAPRSYAAQNRCVTEEDYKAIILSKFPDASSVHVWGGESNTPPTFGEVFVSVKPTENRILSDDEKSFIINDVLGPRKLINIRPRIVDPIFIRLALDVSIYYDPIRTNLLASELISNVRDNILFYSSSDIERFEKVFKFSKLSRIIDDTDVAIVSNTTKLKIIYGITPVLNAAVTYKVDIGNPVYNPGIAGSSIISAGFLSPGSNEVFYISDRSAGESDIGTLFIFAVRNNVRVPITDIGTIDYSNGIITLTGLNISGLVSSDVALEFTIEPDSNDVAAQRNHIIVVDPNLLTVTPIIEKIAESYQFTSSRT